MHGDHIFGLPGLLLSIMDSRDELGLSKDEPLHIYGPKGLGQYIWANLSMSASGVSGLPTFLFAVFSVEQVADIRFFEGIVSSSLAFDRFVMFDLHKVPGRICTVLTLAFCANGKTSVKCTIKSAVSG